MEAQVKHPPFGMKDKLGYMFGDLGNDMTFIFQSMFLMLFYTEVLGIPGASVGTLFLVSRIVDAFTDIGMGRIVDVSPGTEEGKFKPWIRRMAIPVTLASFLMYQSGLQHASMNVKMIYMYVTYLLWGSIFYTAINIPYGSMASAISNDPDDRTELSTWRTIGATTAQIIIGPLVPFFVYTTIEGQQVVKKDGTFTMVAAVFSVLGVIFYYFCHKLTTERVKIEHVEGEEVPSLAETFKGIFSSRSLAGIIFTALFMILSQLMMGAMNNYVLPYVYNTSEALSTLNFINPFIILFLSVPIAGPLSRKFGKRELGIGAMALGACAYFYLYFVKTESYIVYMIGTAIAYFSIGLFNAVIWAAIIDVIDDIEVKTGERDDGTVYGLYSFSRKVGQAIAGAAGGWALTWVGYQSGATHQTPEVLDGIYNTATLVPAVAFTLAALALLFVYPLSKATVDENSRILAERRGETV